MAIHLSSQNMGVSVRLIRKVATEGTGAGQMSFHANKNMPAYNEPHERGRRSGKAENLRLVLFLGYATDNPSLLDEMREAVAN